MNHIDWLRIVHLRIFQRRITLVAGSRNLEALHEFQVELVLTINLDWLIILLGSQIEMNPKTLISHKVRMKSKMQRSLIPSRHSL
jgi:hypothetical protein